MTRKMQATGNAYRAVITSTTVREGKEPSTSTRYEGPYATAGAAKARITQQQNLASQRSLFSYLGTTTVTGYVEKSTTVWERV